MPATNSAYTLLSVIAALSSISDAAPLEVDLGYVGVRGLRNETTGVNSYLGISFAAPPRAPIAIESQNKYTKGQIPNASSHNVQCNQGTPQWSEVVPILTTALASGGASIKSSEDCLHLDIFTPSMPESVSLPVLLSIHGGGYTLGNGADAAAGSNFVNRSDGGMIFVTIQHRLGGYGFLSSDAIEEESAPDAGLLDVRAATESLSEEALTNAIDASYEIGYAQGPYAYGVFYYGPAVDGRIIQDLPFQELEAGYFAKVPLITDHTTFERAGFSNLSTKTLQ
ncbi:hypothetical protein D6D21_01632 [Aureobasidium pullulans]|uniref:Carboxylesterase type B domain-containing protein n=1 Tax=Aureobasidium pullulans TaxID=5580 RepID=A0AB74J7C8_AURPU|nr:hypothetical protein D6D21_01632 [Aureobasidium pullulans]